VAPEAITVPDEPWQIAVGVTLTTTGANLVITTVAVLRHPFAFVPVTVYVVVDAGVAIGFVHDVHDKPVPGDHV